MAKRKSKIRKSVRKSERPSAAFLEPVSARNSETGQDELYLVRDGQRIGKRGHPGTPQARTWIPLVEGISFLSEFDELPDDGTPVVDGGEVQLMPEPKGAKQ
jgi:hypothetical protein